MPGGALDLGLPDGCDVPVQPARRPTPPPLPRRMPGIDAITVGRGRYSAAGHTAWPGLVDLLLPGPPAQQTGLAQGTLRAPGLRRHEPMNVMTGDAAEALSRKAHDRQLDKVGMSYFETHVQDVQRRVVAAGGDVDQQIAALLHDVLEDTEVCEADLRAQGVPEASLHIVLLMTKQEGEDSALYLKRLASSSAARLVKLADIASNTDPMRLTRLDPVQRRRSLTKYIGYLDALGTDAAQLRVLLGEVRSTETDQERQERQERVLEDRMAARLDEMVEKDSFTIHESKTTQQGNDPAADPD